MIPLRRTTTKSLETTLLSYSRQALPRPARLYSTPSTARCNAHLAQSLSAQPELPPYMSRPKGRNGVTVPEDMHDFLKRNTPYTVLPTPLPTDQNSHLNDIYFTDSPTQDLLAVIDACLHNLYDVPRAKQIFQGLRGGSKAEAVLDTRIYNSLLEAFITMAVSKDPGNRLIWLEDAWTLFDSMETGTEVAAPNATTYALMLAVWLRWVIRTLRLPSADIRLGLAPILPTQYRHQTYPYVIPPRCSRELSIVRSPSPRSSPPDPSRRTRKLWTLSSSYPKLLLK